MERVPKLTYAHAHASTGCAQQPLRNVAKAEFHLRKQESNRKPNGLKIRCKCVYKIWWNIMKQIPSKWKSDKNEKKIRRKSAWKRWGIPREKQAINPSKRGKENIPFHERNVKKSSRGKGSPGEGKFLQCSICFHFTPWDIFQSAKKIMSGITPDLTRAVNRQPSYRPGDSKNLSKIQATTCLSWLISSQIRKEARLELIRIR